MSFEHQEETAASTATLRSEVVVIGAGFAGLEVARELGKAGIETTVVDRHNHHLFQPLLYQVATAALSATDVAEPIRKILRRYKPVKVLFGEVSEIDTDARVVRMTCGLVVRFRFLVLASGAGHGYFGHDEWAQWAPGLKTIEDARHIRSQLLLTFERAERTSDDAERQRLLSIAIIGGGPTGVELAGAIAELSRYTLARDFRSISPESTRISLLEAGPRLLSGFSEDMSAYAKARLERLGVHVRTGEAVQDVGPVSFRIAGQAEPVGLVIWAAGVAASPLARQLGDTDRSGRIPVDGTLAVPGRQDAFALGDVAVFTGEDGKVLPGLAQVAKQQGIHLGRALSDHIKTGAPLAPFRYRSRGNTAIVGRHAAVFERGRFKIKGWFAWLAWAVIHVYLLVGFQHRFLVSMQWLWRYLTYDRGARLIAGDYAEVDNPAAAPTPKQRQRKA
ncbi:NAD(P)/FAD-dependent oxidoreductase [Silicimonas algicola]|uniref:NADH:ubiquinone reductase (non-electrogenic) n=1 Tax=Silicimonas algicola TaxID=1826607 RepID=A0A316GI59_9RHOB|nr:NAD(P)/FAD-dependent oxidoreductase [Silicimonas algicola]AZQ66704.1 NAD(P)/FAD-dependent oxidoreductase [Silicimonas algicola]PWK59060.1 NADH dehydrogenase FAD-containing subunit [Silicimonas algicola]